MMLKRNWVSRFWERNDLSSVWFRILLRSPLECCCVYCCFSCSFNPDHAHLINVQPISSRDDVIHNCLIIDAGIASLAASWIIVAVITLLLILNHLMLLVLCFLLFRNLTHLFNRFLPLHKFRVIGLWIINEFNFIPWVEEQDLLEHTSPIVLLHSLF